MTSGRGYQTNTMEHPVNTDPTGSSNNSNGSKNTFADASSDRFQPSSSAAPSDTDHHHHHHRDRDDRDRDRYSSTRHRKYSNGDCRNEEDWKCWECQTYNQYQDSRCKRCDTTPTHKPSANNNHHHHRGGGGGGQRNDDSNNDQYRRRHSGDTYSRRDDTDDPENKFQQPPRHRDGRGGRHSSGGQRYHPHPNDRDSNDGRNDYYGNSSNRREEGRDEDRKRRHDTNDRDNDRTNTNNSNSTRESQQQKPAKSRRLKKTWPPHFESSGASYVFDARSGFFYDAMSDFFYDPKIRLYYGNEKKKYYEYCGEGGVRPPFREVDNQNEEGCVAMGVGGARAGQGMNGEFACSGQDLVVKALQGHATPNTTKKNDDKKKIAICLKKKVPGGRNRARSLSTSTPAVTSDSPTNILTLPPPSQVQKKHNADMEKWSQRGKEMQTSATTGGKDTTTTTTTTTTINAKDNVAQDATTTAVNLTRTVSGKPVCLLCRRKFADITKLRHHEKLSPLHKQNLLKKNKREPKTVDPKTEADNTLSIEYRDRARERRSMYGPESMPLGTSSTLEVAAPIVEMGPSLTNARVVTEVDTITPSQSLGESNIGNKLLQKLGWKKGSALGRSGGIECAAGANESAMATGNGVTVADKLKQDWERIESLAGASGSGRRNRR